MNKLTFTPKEAAEVIGVSLPVVYELCKNSDFPCIHLGRKILVPRQELSEWLHREATNE